MDEDQHQQDGTAEPVGIYQRMSDGLWVGSAWIMTKAGQRERRIVYGKTRDAVEEKLQKLLTGESPIKPKKRRRQRGTGAVFRRADGMWIGQLDLGWVDGKRVRPTVSAKTQKAAIDKLDELKQQVAESGGAPPAKRMRVKEWLDYWFTEIVKPYEKPNTVAFHRPNVYNHLIPALGHEWLHQLQPEHVEQMLKTVRAKTWRGKKLSSTTVMHVHSTLHTALEVARKRRRVTVNVAGLVEAPGRAKNTRGALTAQQARTLLLGNVHDPMIARWMMALLTGERQGGCLGLEWDRVSFDGEYLDLSWGLDALGYRHGCDDIAACTELRHRRPCPDDCPKAKRTSGRRHTCITAGDPKLCPADCTAHAKACPRRELDVPDDYEYRQLDGTLCLVRLKTEASERLVPMVTPLRAALMVRREAYESERQRYAVDHGLVWSRPDGRPLIARDDSAAWKAACEAADVPVIDLHAARNSTATLLLDAGVDIRIVQQILGHSTAAMSRAYQHVPLDMARRGLDALVDLIELPTAV